MIRIYLFISLLFLFSCQNNDKMNASLQKAGGSLNNNLESVIESSDNLSWIDTLNNRVNSYSLNIYDPDKFLKDIIKDTTKLLEFKNYCEQNNNVRALSFALNMLGKNKLNCSDYFTAIQYHKQAYDAALVANDDYLEALSLNMMGVVYRRKSAVKTALEYYTRALRTAEGSNSTESHMLKSIAISNEGIGGLHRMLGQYEKAIIYYKNSLEKEIELGSLLGLSIDYHNIGKSFRLLGQYDSALYYHKRALEYNIQLDSDFGKSICYNNLGVISMKQKETNSAFKYFVPALKLAEAAGDSTYIVNSNINLGWYYLESRQSDSARFYFSQAMKIAKRVGYKAALVRCYDYLSRLEQNNGNASNALQYYKNARIYSDSIVNEKNQQYLVDLTILYDIEKKKRTIETLQYNAKLNKRIQYGKNIVIILLGIVAFVLIILIQLKFQATKKNRLIHSQKEDMFKMQLEMKVLQNERLQAENKQKEMEKELLQDKLETNELARKAEKIALQKEIDHKNRELATAAAYAVKKGESIRKFIDSIEKLKGQENNTNVALSKLQKAIEYDINPESDWENFSLHFESVHPKFFKNLKKKHPGITTNELRLCAYLLMNLSNKEIAALLYISTEAVQKAKYRLKKKFELSSDEKLFDYLLSI